MVQRIQHRGPRVHREHRREKSAEEVFGSGADDAGSGLRAGLEAVPANEHDRRAFGLFHEQAGSGGEFIGNGENRGGEGLSVAIACAAEIKEYRHTRRANGHIRQTQTPGAAEGVTDNNRQALASALTKGGCEFSCGTVRMAWKNSYNIAAGDIGMVDAGVSADETMMCFRDEHMIAADDAPRLIQNHLDGAGIFLQPGGEGTCLPRRRHRPERNQGAFRLGDNLLGDYQDVAPPKAGFSLPRRSQNTPRKIVSGANLCHAGNWKQK